MGDRADEQPCISTMYFEPVPDESGRSTGTYRFHSMQSVETVLERLESVLDSIPMEDGTALSQAEWVMGPDVGFRSRQGNVPPGDPFAAVMRGGSEGHLLRLFALDKSGDEQVAHPMATVKYLIRPEEVYRAARIVNEAFDNGMYATEIAPEFRGRETGGAEMGHWDGDETPNP